MEREAAPCGTAGDTSSEVRIQTRDLVQLPQTEREINSIQQGNKMAKISSLSGNSSCKGTLNSDNVIKEAPPSQRTSEPSCCTYSAE